jgi:GT2 family glycosyltransferase
MNSEQVLLGANCACPAKALKAAGGFDEQLGLDASLGVRRIDEEVEFMLQLRELGMSAWYLPQACVVHFVPERNCSLSYIRSNAEAHGFYYSIVGIPSNFLYGRSTLKSFLDEGPGIQVGGIPFKVFKYFLSEGSRFLWRRLGRKKSYEEYVLLRFCIGMMRGYRQNRKLL